MGQEGESSLVKGIVLCRGFGMQVEELVVDVAIQLTAGVGTVVRIGAYQV